MGGPQTSQVVNTDKSDPPKTESLNWVIIVVLVLCVFIIIGVMWYVRRRRDATGGGGTDCEAQQYKKVLMNDYTQEQIAQRTAETISPIIKNQEPVNTEDLSKPVEQQMESSTIEKKKHGSCSSTNDV